MTRDARETLRAIALQSQLLALGAALEAAGAAQYGQSLARAAAELGRLSEIGLAIQPVKSIDTGIPARDVRQRG